ncbi:hypothetical protein BGI41_01030 [Methanobrevibacter sp. 87.7]|uniref:hypothetical protein n=1 Tax=Methanobrevibacter sp. 87.7 TaxID=387957 RepID=UPI000B50A668|nr:hypothetical protein [Methanobrevibacter sp. 87.7]OWT33709.1 hypothetical protein BGI41_01030 [Methanobrevibacter sp. 87.7]
MLIIFWQFTDYDYWNSDDPYIKDVIDLYNKGFRVANNGTVLKINETTYKVFEFKTLVSPEVQNLFAYKTRLININDLKYNFTINKISLTPKVYLGNQTLFKIIVKNTCNFALYNVYVTELDFDDLIYDSWKLENGNWISIYENNLNKWKLKEPLNPNENASFIINFNTTSTGNKTNTIISGSDNTNQTETYNKTEVINNNTEDNNKTDNNTETKDNKTNKHYEPKQTNTYQLNNTINKVDRTLNTGNPLLILIFSLILLVIASYKGKN